MNKAVQVRMHSILYSAFRFALNIAERYGMVSLSVMREAFTFSGNPKKAKNISVKREVPL